MSGDKKITEITRLQLPSAKPLDNERTESKEDIRMEEKMEGQEVQEGNGHGRDRPVRANRRDGPDRSGIMEGPPRAQQTRGKKRISVWMILLAVLILALLAAGLFHIREKKTSKKPEGLVYEANIVSGDLPGKTREERQRELNSIVEEGMLAMSINATPTGKTSGADQDINWLIENPSNQGKLIRVEVWKDDTGEKIYETGAIPPGNYVESAPLSVKLPPGRHHCTAKFFAYKEGDEDYIGQAAAQIILTLYE